MLVETCQDLLQAKLVVIGVLDGLRKADKRRPVTVQESGIMLLGTEIAAARTALEPLEVEVIGLNSVTRPKQMNDAVRHLALNSTQEVSVPPNSGLPVNEDRHPVFKLQPATSAIALQPPSAKYFVV